METDKVSIHTEVNEHRVRSEHRGQEKNPMLVESIVRHIQRRERLVCHECREKLGDTVASTKTIVREVK